VINKHQIIQKAFPKNILSNIDSHLGEISFYLTVALMLIWALPGTIAIRHSLLLLGFLFSGLYLIKNRTRMLSISSLPLFIFLILFFWVIAHYLWIGTDSQVQLKELTSLWLRVLGGITMAIATGIFLQRAHHLQKLLLISFFSIPIFTILFYLYGSYKSHYFLIPNDFVGLYLANKVNTAFFSVICVAIGCASFLWGLLTQIPKGKNNYFKFALLGALISLMSAVLASSKNGVGISLVLLSFAALCGLYIIIRNQQLNIKYAIQILFIPIVIFIAFTNHSKYAAPGWNHLVEDIQVSVQIEKYQNWKNTPQLGFPKRPDGGDVAGNTYERFAWGTKGIELIQKYPLGYGTINQGSFRPLLAREGIIFPNNNQTHSGWIDFGLAFGIPGLIILLSALLGTIIFAIRKKDYLSMIAIWISIAIILACCLIEVSFKHTFEIWMFLIAFGCALVIQIPKPANSELVPIE
jgi:hypothetical protein